MDASRDTVFAKAGTAKQRLSETFKDSEDYLKGELQNLIMNCNEQDKEAIKKAYVIRNGQRPRSKFEYLQKAYGIHFPAKIRHIPVLKSMFDAILAIEQTKPLDYKITSRDIDTLKSSQEEQKNAIVKEFVSLAKEQIKATSEWYNAVREGEEVLQPEKFDKQKVKRIISKITNNFKSSLEINAQDFLESLIQRFEIEIMKSLMCEDLMTSGSEYYQVKALEKGKRPLVRVINPLELYFRKDPNKKFLKDHSHVMLKQSVTIADLLTNHGHEMEIKHVKAILEACDVNIDSGNKFWNMTYMSYTKLKECNAVTKYDDLYEKEVTLYYGEWLANTEIGYEESYLDGMEVKYKKKRRYRKDRYEGYRVNDDIYFGLKKADFIYRPADEPDQCFLTINGTSYNDRNGEPYSLVLNTEDIADKIDMLHYLWESMVAMSGNKAAMIHYKAIPKWVGDDGHDRVIKWLGMVKQGAAIVDPSQPGAENFNNSGSIDMSLDASISVILDMIKYLEEVAGKVTGVSQQMMGSIDQSALKGTTNAAINQSSLVLAPFFFTHGTVVKQMLTDILNVSRLVYENGHIGSYVLGEMQQKIFSIDNERFWLADFDVWLSNSGDESKAIEELKALAIELVKANQLDAMDAVSIGTIKSLTKIKQTIKDSIENREEKESDQLRSQLESLQEEFQKLERDLAKIDQAKANMAERELQMKMKQLEFDYALKTRDLDIKEDLGTKEIELDKKRVELEALQISFDPKSAEVRND
jgi:hypothetical protein